MLNYWKPTHGRIWPRKDPLRLLTLTLPPHPAMVFQERTTTDKRVGLNRLRCSLEPEPTELAHTIHAPLPCQNTLFAVRARRDSILDQDRIYKNFTDRCMDLLLFIRSRGSRQNLQHLREDVGAWSTPSPARRSTDGFCSAASPEDGANLGHWNALLGTVSMLD